MRVVFMGYQTWGHRVLAALLDSAHEVPLVITHPRSNHAYETIWADSVQGLAADAGIPTLVRSYANDDEVVDTLRELEPDILVSSDWRSWVAPRTYAVAEHGAINIHDGLLPRYGGFAPLNWALINGESEVGVTVHFMNEEFDLGDIVLQERVPIEPKDTVTTLFHKTIDLFAPMTLDALDLIASGCTTWTKQDPAEATFFHKRSVEDSRIHWDRSAVQISNLVRAQVDPYPSAFTFHDGTRLEVLAAHASERRYGGTPGRIFCREGEGVVVVCGPRAGTGEEPGIVIEQVRLPDGDVRSAHEMFPRMGGYLTERAW